MKKPTSSDESFDTTNWSMVVMAGAGGSQEAEDALAALCRRYWFPLFAFARRLGHEPAQAEDHTQAFFETLLEKDFLKDVDRSLGRFRSFLLAAFKHFLANVRRADRALKRGGGRRILSIDAGMAEARYSREPAHSLDADRLFERQWVLTLLDHVLQNLDEEYRKAGKENLFRSLQGHLTGSAEAPYRETAAKLNISEAAVKVAVHRLRRRFGELLRREIALTVVNHGDIEDEVQNLFNILRV